MRYSSVRLSQVPLCRDRNLEFIRQKEKRGPGCTTLGAPRAELAAPPASGRPTGVRMMHMPLLSSANRCRCLHGPTPALLCFEPFAPIIPKPLPFANRRSPGPGRPLEAGSLLPTSWPVRGTYPRQSTSHLWGRRCSSTDLVFVVAALAAWRSPKSPEPDRCSCVERFDSGQPL